MDELKLGELIKDINSVLFSTLRRVNLGNSRVANSVRLELKDNDFQIKFNDYIHYVDSGRRAGAKPPPVKPILDWIHRKGITPTNITQERLAYAISRAIGRNGIKSRPFLDRLTEEVSELVKIHIFEEMNRILKDVLNY